MVCVGLHLVVSPDTYVPLHEVTQLPEPSSTSSFRPQSNTKNKLLTELEDRLLSTLSSEP